jgi:hypothetical protein
MSAGSAVSISHGGSRTSIRSSSFSTTTWAFRFRGPERYADRYAAQPGQRAKYLGTRGMVCDTSAFLHPNVFACPKRYWFVEDLWLSYVLDDVFGWPLYKSAGEIATDADEHDQNRFLWPTKDRFFRYLVRRGWNPLLPDEKQPSAEELVSASANSSDSSG